MKKIILVLAIAAFGTRLLNAQQPRPGSDPYQSQPAQPQLTHFDLDFPGGSPTMLVKAIEKASGKPLNVIIPPEDENLSMPPLKMRSVTVPELFGALTSASHKMVNVVTGTFIGGNGLPSPQYTRVAFDYGFTTAGTVRDESIWYFYSSHPPLPGQEFKPDRICRFFQLGPYLETYKIEDVTTAIETGWKMLGAGHDFTPPEISFHKDTKLLIAVGDPEKLELIDSVLKQLSAGKTSAAKTPAPAKSGEPAKP